MTRAQDDTARLSQAAAGAPRSWPRLILGSTSPYRRELLGKLGLPFATCAPRVDEVALPGESPQALAERLALAKAADVCAQNPGDVLVIGSDQVADLAGQALGKPGHLEAARAQLQAMRGRELFFHTAVCVMRPQTGFARVGLSTVRVRVRPLSDAEIDTYLLAEPAFDCAGSAKVEGLGIVLMEDVEANDPTSLIGLPLILTTALMREAGADTLSWRASLAIA